MIVVCHIFFDDVFTVKFGDNHIVADCFFVIFKIREKIATIVVIMSNINDVYFVVPIDYTIYSICFAVFFIDLL